MEADRQVGGVCGFMGILPDDNEDRRVCGYFIKIKFKHPLQHLH